jgi:hypothetical protein
MNNFPVRLRALMDAQGLTQQALAQRARTSQASIFRYLSAGVRPQPKAMADLALALGVHPEWLNTGKGEKFLPPGVGLANVGRPLLSRSQDPASEPPPEITATMNAQHESPFQGHTESELWEFITETSSAAKKEKPLNKRIFLGNIQSATEELRRRISNPALGLAFAFLFIGSATTSARLNETPEECTARYGQPIHSNAAAGFKLYHKAGFEIGVLFINGRAATIAFNKAAKNAIGTPEAMTAAEVETLLETNGAGNAWHPLNASPLDPSWIRADSLATAVHRLNENRLTITTAAAAQKAAEDALEKDKSNLKGF